MTSVKRTIILFVMAILACMPDTIVAQRKMETLGRGTVAIRKNTSAVFVSWRIPGNEFDSETTYNLYRNHELIASNLTVSNYTDQTSANGNYQVAAVVNDEEQALSPETSVVTKRYIQVPLADIGDYYVHLAWVGDLDGDGEFEFVVDRIPNSANSTCKLEAYTIDGERLWQIDLGPLSIDRDGIEGGAAAISNGMWDGVDVYDLDSDGKAEVVLKTADGTIFGDKAVLDYNSTVQNFLSVLDGETGAEKARIALPTKYISDGPLQTQLTIAYLDGIHPSVVVKAKNRVGSAGFNLVMAAYDYDGQSLSERWTWYRGSQDCPDFHQQRIADVDLDGKDEICDGGYFIDDDGTLLYSLGPEGIVHGDRFHIGDFDPDRPGLEGYGIQQDNASGLAWFYYDAKDGTLLQTQYLSSIGDYARGNVADLDPNHRGFEMWTFTDGIYNVQDGKITDRITDSYPNFRIWWDGDVQSEMLDGVKFNDWNYSTDSEERIFTASDYGAITTWRNAPVIYGDILGDWREEVVFEKGDHSSLLIFTTLDPTEERIYTLLHNPEYRLCLTTKGYLQSAQLDYYLGYDRSTPPIPPMQKASAVWSGQASQNWNTAEQNWEVNNQDGSYNDGDTVLFGIPGENNPNVVIDEQLAPSCIYMISPVDYTFSGKGELAGKGRFIKSGYSKFNLNVKSTYTGTTKVEQGEMYINAELTASDVVVYGGATLGGIGTIEGNCSLEDHACIAPGNTELTGTLTLEQSLNLNEGVVCKFDLPNKLSASFLPEDKIVTRGDLQVSEQVIFRFHPIDVEITGGDYPLITYDGERTGDLGNIKIEGLFGKKYQLIDTLNTLTLRVFETRSSSAITWAGTENLWDLQNSGNFLLAANPVTFVSGDTVIFDETGVANSTVLLDGDLPIGQMQVNGDNVDYRFEGEGTIGGNGDLIKNGKGRLEMQVTSNVYTGKTVINGGRFIAHSLANAGTASSIGANPSTAADELVVNDAYFSLNASDDCYTDKGLTLSGETDTLDIATPGTTLSVNGKIAGEGQLVKTGSGTLYLLENNNTYSGGTSIEWGTIQLNDPGSGKTIGALGTGPVTFKGGILRMGNVRDYTTCAMNFVVPEGKSGTLYADQRCNFDGKLTGSGTLKLVLPGDIDRTIFRGDWSGFKGTVKVSGVAPLRLASSAGYRNMTFDLAPELSMYFSSGTSSGNSSAETVHIGGLTGSSSSVIKDENWFIGGANSDVSYDGKINGRSLTKEGSGTLTLTNDNPYTGGTTINSGVLFVAGTSGSATGSGAVVVNSGGTLDGKGSIDGKVTVAENGTLAVAGENIGKLTINNSVVLNKGAIVSFTANSMVSISDKLILGTNKLTLNGTLKITNLHSGDFFEGNSFHLFEAGEISGAFDEIIPSTPGEGLEWDTSELNDQGILKVMQGTGVSAFSNELLALYPNPVTDQLKLVYKSSFKVSSIAVKNISGQLVLNNLSPEAKSIDFSTLAPGVYTIEIHSSRGSIVKKVVKGL